MALRGGHNGAAEQAVMAEAVQQVGDLVRRLGTDQAAANAQRREIRLVAGALGELGGAADQSLGVECEADYGLGIQVNDGSLLLLYGQSLEVLLLGKIPWCAGVVLAEYPLCIPPEAPEYAP